MQIKKDIMWRINLTFILICLMALAILGQILNIQYRQASYLIPKADSATTRVIEIPAIRGNIFSDNGSLLATSVPVFDIRVDTRSEGFVDNDKVDSDIDSLAICFSKLFKDHSPEVYAHTIRQAKFHKERYFLLQRNVTYNEMQKIRQFPIFRRGRYKGGFCLEQKEVREIPFQKLASRTIGYLREFKPVGIEASFDSDLSGEEGQRLVQEISGNVWMPISDKDVVEPKDGNDIVTTLDINIQGVAETSLQNQLIAQNADHGCAIVMEVATGEIKAIANLSRTSMGTYLEDINYAISESTEPGSTMKMASVLAGLDDGYLEPKDTVDVENGICKYADHFMKDAHAPKSRRMTIQQAFETSSNVGISKAIVRAYAKNPQAFIDKLKSFGLASKLGLQIEGEGTPYIKSTHDKTWSALSLPWISIGYESSFTPLQILTFYNAIANNGRMVKPHFVKEIRNHGKIVKSFPVTVLHESIASQAALAKARKMLEGVVQQGTATSLKSSSYLIAGKTGTAQISKDKNGYDKVNKSYQASFVGYFPADAPKYSCMVVVNSPSNNLYYGGAVAAPVFKEIADKVYSNHLEINSQIAKSDSVSQSIPVVKAGVQKELVKIFKAFDLPAFSNDVDAEIVSVVGVSNPINLKERKITSQTIPDVKGMGAKDAISILENSGLRVVCKGKGYVVRQSLSPGNKLFKGQLIEVELGI